MNPKTEQAVKEHPIIFSTDMVKAILEGRCTQTRRVVTPQTSMVGVGRVDWMYFDWKGETYHDFECARYSTESEFVPDELKGKLIGIKQAPLPLVDGRADEHYPYEHQYLHVPYKWAENATIYRIYPRWNVGDRLWVRESWFAEKRYDHLKPSQIPNTSLIGYTATDTKLKLDWAGKTRSARSMPRWAFRIKLEITEIRVERLQEISGEDAIAEGILFPNPHSWLTEVIGIKVQLVWDSLNAKRGYGWDKNPFVWVIGFKRIEQ